MSPGGAAVARQPSRAARRQAAGIAHGRRAEFAGSTRRESAVAVALGNLIGNAVKYTQSGDVVVRVGEGAVEVVDSGPGLSAEDAAKLFERGYRGTHAGHSQGGGIGLSIVRRLCALYGWDVRVRPAKPRAWSRPSASPDPRAAAGFGGIMGVPTVSPERRMTAAASPLEYQVRLSDHARTPAERDAILAGDLGFGRYFTDHMVAIQWDQARGWHDAQVRAYGPLSLDRLPPCCTTARRSSRGSRPTGMPMARSGRSARCQRRAPATLGGAPDPAATAGGRVHRIVAPAGRGRPCVGAVGAGEQPVLPALHDRHRSLLGVRPARRRVLRHRQPGWARISPRAWRRSRSGCPRTTPAPPRAAPARAKCGGNYAASLLPQQEAYAQGCSQVLFLDPVEGRYLEELGGMNVFLVRRDGRIVTPNSPAASSRASPAQHPAAGPRPRPGGRGAQGVDRRVEGGRGLRRDQRGLRLRDRGGGHPIGALKATVRGRRHRRARRRGHHGDPQGTDRHPVRPDPRPPRLAGAPALMGPVPAAAATAQPHPPATRFRRTENTVREGVLHWPGSARHATRSAWLGALGWRWARPWLHRNARCPRRTHWCRPRTSAAHRPAAGWRSPAADPSAGTHWRWTCRSSRKPAMRLTSPDWIALPSE